MEPVLPAHVGLRCANPTYKTSLQILARCTHRSAEQGPLWGCDRVGVRKPAFIPVRRHPATGSHPRARGPCSALRGRTSLWFATCLGRQRDSCSCGRHFDHPK